MPWLARYLGLLQCCCTAVTTTVIMSPCPWRHPKSGWTGLWLPNGAVGVSVYCKGLDQMAFKSFFQLSGSMITVHWLIIIPSPFLLFPRQQYAFHKQPHLLVTLLVPITEMGKGMTFCQSLMQQLTLQYFLGTAICEDEISRPIGSKELLLLYQLFTCNKKRSHMRDGTYLCTSRLQRAKDF